MRHWGASDCNECGTETFSKLSRFRKATASVKILQITKALRLLNNDRHEEDHYKFRPQLLRLQFHNEAHTTDPHHDYQ